MKRKLLVSGILLAAFSLFVGMGMTLMAQPTARVAAQTDASQPRTIQVSGRGQVSAQPDRAVVRLGVQTEADTAQAALAANNEQMTAVISATLEAGIDEADIQTQGLRLQPVYNSGSDTQQPELTGYRANNTVQITVRDLDRLGELLDTAVAAGSNTIEGIQFEVSNQADLEAAAREAAMQNAQDKAEQLTKLAGAELGPVQTILETGGSSPRPVTLASQESAVSAASVPVQAGTQFIEASVQVTWEIR
jgi:uncharacterized protein